MTKKPTVTTLASGFNSTETLNANFEALRDGFDNTLSLDGSTPNAMEADLDLNGNNIIGAAGLLINGTDYLSDVEAAKVAALAAQAAAETAETNAETAETNAATSATSAATSATASATSATAAAASEAGVDADRVAAQAAASTATTKASEASTSETNAATSASTATTKASEAATSATNSATSATESETAKTAAEAAKDAALAALDNFDDRYLGSKASDPTLDNDGNALVAGALYYNTTDDVMKVYEGTAWVAAYASLSGALVATNNLSDVVNVSSSRTNLGLGTTDSPTFGGVTLSGTEPKLYISETDTSASHRIVSSGGALYIQAEDSDGTSDGDLHLTGMLNQDLNLLNIKAVTTAMNGNLTATGTVTSGDVTFSNTNPLISTSGQTGSLTISGDADGVSGANMLLYGSSHATLSDDILFRTNALNVLQYNANTEVWDFQVTDITTTGSVTANGITLDNTNPVIKSADADGFLGITGGTSGALGGNMRLYGPTHASFANDIVFRTTTAVQFRYDDSASTWNFQGNDITTTGTVTATSYAGDGSALTGIAAGAGGGGSDEIFWENGQNVTTNYTVTNGKNAMSAGPITINSGVTVTVGAGETWTVI